MERLYKKSFKKLITLIITKDYPKKLQRILSSIQKNNFLSNSKILIVDNSRKEANRIKNSKLVSNIIKNRIIYVDKFCWIRLIDVLVKRLKERKIMALLKDINLGTNGGDVHHARNVAAIICSILYNNIDLIICFDDDMVIPKKFGFDKEKIVYPNGIPLRGSPDLSRLEWIRLYIRFLNKKKDQINKEDYIIKLIKIFGFSDIKDLIETYTNITMNKLSKKNIMNIPIREELNSGSFISPIKNLSKEIYPLWFDNDWFWFRRDRKKNKYPLKFINNSIIHLSSKKDIFDKGLLKFEEIGKIIASITKNKKRGYIPNNNEIKDEIKRRKNALRNEIDLSQTVLLETNKLEEKKTILKIISSLRYLSGFLGKIQPPSIKKQMVSYEKNNNYWYNLIYKINKETYLKQELFRILNRKEILVFSPHCDDAIFSMGGIIQNKYLNKIKSYTVYTRSKYYLKKPELKEDITKIRLNEESIALGRLKIKPTFLEFDDSTLREYASEMDYISPENNPKEDSSFIEVKNKIYQIVKGQPDKILMFPLGLGHNIDHTILFEIGKELIKKNYLVLFYEDIGYDMIKEEGLINSYLKDRTPPLASRTFPFDNIRDKLDLCKMYKTQISESLLRDIEEIAIKRRGERIWGAEETLDILNL